MKKALVIEIIASLLIILFVYTALSKLLDYQTFKGQLAKSPYISPFAGLTAWALPAGELLIVGALLLTRTRLIGLYASFALMLLFTIYIYVMLHYSPYVPCSCGGVLSQLSWEQHLLFNIVFTILALTGIVLTMVRRKPPQQLSAIPV